MKRIPLGVTEFAEIRHISKNYFYTDNTKLLYHLATRPEPRFLARPEGFGKTLLVSALENLLKGNRELFKGLWIDSSDYRFKPHLVMRLNMGDMVADTPSEMKDMINDRLAKMAASHKIYVRFQHINKDFPGVLFATVVYHFKKKYGNRVAVVIDDCDAPIVEHFADPELAEQFRSALDDFYFILKSEEKHFSHIFMTGVNRFTPSFKLFPRDNVLESTFDPKFAGLLGFGDCVLDRLVDEYQEPIVAKMVSDGLLPAGADKSHLKALIEEWYGGYSWDGTTKVANPLSVLQFLNSGNLEKYWFDAAAPFHLKQFAKRGERPFDLAALPRIMPESEMMIDEIANWDPSVYMLQAGCLTVKETLSGPESMPESMPLYSLDIPNREVAESIKPILQEIETPEDPKAEMKREKDAVDAVYDF